MKPDRVVLGVDSDCEGEVLRDLHEPFVRGGAPILIMDVPAAGITRYADKATLGTRISFRSAIALRCVLITGTASPMGSRRTEMVRSDSPGAEPSPTR